MADDEHGEAHFRDPYAANEDDVAAEREARFAPGSCVCTFARCVCGAPKRARHA
jgi:hypothetical protein